MVIGCGFKSCLSLHYHTCQSKQWITCIVLWSPYSDSNIKKLWYEMMIMIYFLRQLKEIKLDIIKCWLLWRMRDLLIGQGCQLLYLLLTVNKQWFWLIHIYFAIVRAGFCIFLWIFVHLGFKVYLVGCTGGHTCVMSQIWENQNQQFLTVLQHLSVFELID